MNAIDTTRPILLVDDNPMDIDLTLRAFSRRKVINPFVVARDGEEALAYVDKWDSGEPAPAVILLDLKLPKIDGLEVLRILKEHRRYKSIPVVMLTTSNEEQDIEHAYRLGANSYIVKPVDFEKFIEVAAQIEVYWMVLNCAPRPAAG